MDLQAYQIEGFHDELLDGSLRPRPGAELLVSRLAAASDGELAERQRAADRLLLTMGITFNVYGHEAGTEKIWPFDVVPRVIEAAEWAVIERGLKQRIHALNLFIDDIYNRRRIVADGVVPDWLVDSGKCFRGPCAGLAPPRGVWCHITGTDLVRGGDGVIYVLEDNLRTPSGVSYVLENREVMKRTFPQLFAGQRISPVENYPEKLLAMLEYIAPPQARDPTVVVLTPGIYNSAYFEHSFLARSMGIEIVTGADLVVQNDRVYMKTTKGPKPVHVIYRRIDDDFLDPKVFRPDSLLGVPGLVEAYRKGNVSLANSIGTGVADDKVVYYYVPAMIKFYLGEDPVLPNVETFLSAVPSDRKYILENLENLVVKSANESGGYGMLIGPRATKDEIAHFRGLIKADPRNFIAQPVISLSRSPTWCDGSMQGRHIDLRPFVLCGEEVRIIPGGLTRVAMREGSLVVNSSQGGGSKDTWVLDGGSASC